MKSSVYKSYDELPLFLNSDLVAKTLGIAPSSAYELMHEKDFPAPQDDASFSSDPKRKAFTDEMLVMKDFDGRLLDRFLLEMRRAKIARVALKAVLTPDNITWNSFALHDELQKEHEAMTKEPPSAT